MRKPFHARPPIPQAALNIAHLYHCSFVGNIDMLTLHRRLEVFTVRSNFITSLPPKIVIIDLGWTRIKTAIVGNASLPNTLTDLRIHRYNLQVIVRTVDGALCDERGSCIGMLRQLNYEV